MQKTHQLCLLEHTQLLCNTVESTRAYFQKNKDLRCITFRTPGSERCNIPKKIVVFENTSAIAWPYGCRQQSISLPSSRVISSAAPLIVDARYQSFGPSFFWPFLLQRDSPEQWRGERVHSSLRSRGCTQHQLLTALDIQYAISQSRTYVRKEVFKEIKAGRYCCCINTGYTGIIGNDQGHLSHWKVKHLIVCGDSILFVVHISMDSVNRSIVWC